MDSHQLPLAKKGAKHSIESLLDQSGLSLGLLELHGEELARYGFGAEEQASLGALYERMSRAIGTRHADVVDSRLATRKEHAARDATKAFIGKLRIAAPIVVRSCEHPSVTLSSFRAGGKLRRSTGRVYHYLVSVRPLVVKLEEGFRPYFAGASVVAILDELLATLGQAAGIQESRRASRPIETLNLNVAKGELLQLIEDLNRVARLAFANQPAIAKQFHKRIMLRHKHKRGAKQDQTVEAPVPVENAVAPAEAALPAPVPSAEPLGSSAAAAQPAIPATEAAVEPRPPANETLPSGQPSR